MSIPAGIVSGAVSQVANNQESQQIAIQSAQGLVKVLGSMFHYTSMVFTGSGMVDGFKVLASSTYHLKNAAQGFVQSQDLGNQSARESLGKARDELKLLPHAAFLVGCGVAVRHAGRAIQSDSVMNFVARVAAS